MKKFLSVLVVLMLLVSVSALAEDTVRIGQIQAAAHGTKCFCVATVAMQGDVIVAVYLDEYQFMAKDTAIGVPNSDADFGKSFPEGKVLASKKVNSDTYSANMAKSGSTVALKDNYAAIEAYCTGKTIAELEAAIAGKDAAGAVDLVTGCTLVDTLGYLNAIIAAAKSI